MGLRGDACEVAAALARRLDDDGRESMAIAVRAFERVLRHLSRASNVPISRAKALADRWALTSAWTERRMRRKRLSETLSIKVGLGTKALRLLAQEFDMALRDQTPIQGVPVERIEETRSPMRTPLPPRRR